MKLRKLTAAEVTFTVELEPEDLEVRGNLICSDDPEYDRAAEDEIIARLNQDDMSAWCCVMVTAEWEGFKGHVSLGGCSFSEGDGYSIKRQSDETVEAHGMKDEALDALNEKIQRHVDKAQALAERLKVQAESAERSVPPKKRKR